MATRLSVTNVSLGQADFLTDRGRRALPAWLFSFAGVTGNYAVLAVESPSLFSPKRSNVTGMGSATIDRTGRHISFFLGGWPIGTGPCTASYRAVVESSAAAVAIAQDEIAFHEPPNGEACALVATPSRPLRITLPRPLGSRVLVDGAGGGALVVTEQSR